MMKMWHVLHLAWLHSLLIDGLALFHQKTYHMQSQKASNHHQQNRGFLLHMMNRPAIGMFGMQYWNCRIAVIIYLLNDNLHEFAVGLQCVLWHFRLSVAVVICVRMAEQTELVFVMDWRLTV